MQNNINRTEIFTQWMERNSLTRTQAAEILDIEVGTVNRYFFSSKNKRSPSWEIIQKVQIMEANLNLNQMVRAKVTPTGLKYLRELVSTQPDIEMLINDVFEQGYIEVHLWELMSLFGSAMSYPTLHPVIEPGIVVLSGESEL